MKGKIHIKFVSYCIIYVHSFTTRNATQTKNFLAVIIFVQLEEMPQQRPTLEAPFFFRGREVVDDLDREQKMAVCFQEIRMFFFIDLFIHFIQNMLCII